MEVSACLGMPGGDSLLGAAMVPQAHLAGTAPISTVPVAGSVQAYLGAPGRIPTTVEARVAPAGEFGVRRVIRPGIEMEEKLQAETREVTRDIFEQLKVKVAENLQVDPSRVKMLIPDVNKPVARYQIDGGATKEMYLGGREFYHLRNKLAKTIGGETLRGDRDLPEWSDGVHGAMTGGHALRSIPMERRNSLPQTFEGYVKGHPDIENETMKKMATAHVYRDEMTRLLKAKLQPAKIELQVLRNATAPDFEAISGAQGKVLQLERNLRMLEEVDMYALQTFLVHEDSLPEIQSDLAKTMKPWYKRSMQLSREHEQYAARIAALKITDPLDYIRHCERHRLDYNQHMAVEQGLLTPSKLSTLFEDGITADELQAIQTKVETLHGEMESETPEECIKLYKAAVTP